VSEDFSRIMLEVFRRLICSRTSEPQVIMAAIKAFSKLDCWKADDSRHTGRCIQI